MQLITRERAQHSMLRDHPLFLTRSRSTGTILCALSSMTSMTPRMNESKRRCVVLHVGGDTHALAAEVENLDRVVGAVHELLVDAAERKSRRAIKNRV